MASFLEFADSGSRFNISEGLNFISNTDVASFNTYIIDNESIQPKHALITCDNLQYKIIDIGSNGTSIKLNDVFEMLEPMKPQEITNSDVLRFGSVIATFRVTEIDEIVESSQTVSQYESCGSPKINNNLSHILVPGTEVEAEDVDIPETQMWPEQINETEILDIISEKDETSNHAMYSQNVFAEFSSCHGAKVDDGLGDFEIRFRAQENKILDSGDDTTDFDNVVEREESITPDIPNIVVKKEPQTQKENQFDIATQINPEIQFEQFDNETQLNPPSPRVNQWDIATQINPEVQFDNETLSNPPSPRVNQCDIATQINPDIQLKQEIETQENLILQETQIMEIENNDSFDSEKENDDLMMQPTQPVFSHFKTRQQLKRQAEIKPKTISLTQFDTDDSSIPLKKRKTFSMETQPIIPLIPEKARGLSDRKVNRILISDDEDDSDDEESRQTVGKIITSLDSDQPKNDVAAADFKTPDKRAERSYPIDESTPDILPGIPSDSQFERCLEFVNNTGNADDSTTSMEEEKDENANKLQQTESSVPKRNLRRVKLMNCESDSDEDNQPTHKIVPKGRKKKEIEEKKVYSFAVSSYPEAAEEFGEVINKLGGKIVDRIAEAEFLLTKPSLKPTSKVLAAISKGIPIVSDEFFRASDTAGKWLNPFDFVILNKQVEEAKKFKLKESITKASNQKLFENCSVFVTNNTKIPFDQLKDIIENAGGECLTMPQKPRTKNLFMCFNVNEKKEIEKIKKKYKGITEFLDTSMSLKFLRQEL